MALVSPGVEVTIVDQSQYLPAAPSSVPFILLATAENKSNAAGTGVATATLAANANKLYRITSQRDLVTLYGNPFFYKTTTGTPLQGYELNEYGLLAAYSALGSSNLCYVLRADIDLASLVGRTGRPAGAPPDGTYWLNTVSSSWGIFEFNQSTGAFTRKTPLVIADNDLLLDTTTGQPKTSVGNIGDYAIVFIVNTDGYSSAAQPDTYDTYWYKDASNNWVVLGGADWRANWPTIQGTNAPVSLTAANTFTVNGVEITVPASPNNTVTGVATAINAANIPFVSAASVNDKLEMFHANDGTIVVATGTGTVLTNLGITAGTYYSPALFFGTNAQQPLWRTTDAVSRPTGSVWIKTNAANGGTQINISQYVAATETYISRNCPMSSNDWTYTNTVDSTGGKNIAVGTLYAQYSSDPSFIGPVQIFRRSASGPSVFSGIYTAAEITGGVDFTVQVSLPGSDNLSSDYTVSLPVSVDPLTAADFVTAWTAANIPYTTAEVGITGAIILTHTEGGVIVMNDGGLSPSPVAEAGFETGLTPGAKWGPYKTMTYTEVTATGGAGTGAEFTVETSGYVPTFTITTAGASYVAGNVLTITDGNPLTSYTVKVTGVNGGGGITSVQWLSGYATPEYTVQLSNWRSFIFIPNEIAPTIYPSNNTNWFYSVVNQVDIMTNVGGEWKGYGNVSYATNGLPQAVGTPSTDPNGPIISASAPTSQSDGTALVYGDLWINSSAEALENYPAISRWQEVDGQDQWVAIDNTDQTTENGIVFADARWASNGSTDPIDDPLPTIVSLLTSNYLDLDAPDATLYPQGTLLFNTRRSGYNVKQFRLNYFNSTNFPNDILPAETSTWVSVSGLQSNGAPYMGRKAQRNMVVQSLRSAIGTNTQIREEETFFNLIACPNYPELQSDMIVLNNDRSQTSYIIGDTPMRLPDTGTAIVDWATNQAGATSTGEDGLVTRNTYMGIYYPSGITADLTGTQVVVPPSHMILRTMIYNDTVAYPWFAPAGQRRGIIDNADNIGYINSQTGEFVPTKNRIGMRNVQYSNFINPIAFFTNVGLLNYGNKNSFDSQSALDRTNVARLVAYLRYQLQSALRPFIFEPNDTITRAEATGVVQTLLADVLSKRGIYDYVVVCDETNNTPERIDRNELWVDIAIEPVKAVEFIYIPVRILNTGEISGIGTSNVA
jgi:hypothetical protein